MKLKTLLSSALMLAASASSLAASINYEVRMPLGGNMVATPAAFSIDLLAFDLPAAQKNFPYSFDLKGASTLSLTGSAPPASGLLSWTLTGALPAGLTLDPATGVISGTATTKGTGTPFDMEASYDGQSDVQAYAIDVEGVPIQGSAYRNSGRHSCFLLAPNRLACTGENTYGQLGNGETSAQETTLVDVTGLPTNVADVGTGTYHTCALLTNGTVYCWGRGLEGQLGDGNGANSITPVAISGIVDATKISVGGNHACVIRSGGGVACWGDNSNGQIGNGSSGFGAKAVSPYNIAAVASNVSHISVGGALSCAIHAGAAKCWGAGNVGQIGNSGTVLRTSPTQVTGLTSSVTEISAISGSHVCAIHSGAAKCWGSNTKGQLGDGTTTQRSAPVAVSGLGGAPTTIYAAAGSVTCARIADGSINCWGNNSDRQLGNGSAVASSTAPVAVTNLDATNNWISGSNRHICVQTTDLKYQCWGGRTGWPDEFDKYYMEF